MPYAVALACVMQFYLSSKVSEPRFVLSPYIKIKNIFYGKHKYLKYISSSLPLARKQQKFSTFMHDHKELFTCAQVILSLVTLISCRGFRLNFRGFDSIKGRASYEVFELFKKTKQGESGFSAS